jgi:DNA-binding NarL/FixJ family response regulator
VLVVDDHPAFRRVARALLARAGLQVVGEAVDGASALAQAARLRPDVVLLDVALPDIDGLAVCARLTAAAGPVPVVVLTSSRDWSPDVVAAAGARAFVPKDRLSPDLLARVTA